MQAATYNRRRAAKVAAEAAPTWGGNSAEADEAAVAPGGNVPAARSEAISYAAYQVLRFRYQNSAGATETALHTR